MVSVTAPAFGSVDGVRLVWVPGRQATGGRLLVRSGVADETLLVHGWTHLFEHWVLSSLELPHGQHNGSTNAVHLSFDLAGGPQGLRDGLEALGGLLGTLQEVGTTGVVPDRLRGMGARLPNDVRVVRAEAEGRGVRQTLAGRDLTARLGHRGVGLVDSFEMGLLDVDALRLASFMAPRLGAGNAVLVLDGEPPEGLRLPLPAGPSVPAPRLPAQAQGARRRRDKELGLTMVVPAQASGGLVAECLTLDFADDQLGRQPLDTEQDLIALALEPTALDVVARWLAEGPSAETVDRARGRLARWEESSVTVVERAGRDALTWLQTGHQPVAGPDLALPEWRRICSTMVLAVPRDMELPRDLLALPEMHPDRPRLAGRVHRAVVPDVASLDLVLAPGALQVAVSAELGSAPLDLGDLAGARRFPDGGVELYGRLGHAPMAIEPWCWESGHQLVAELVRQSDPRVWRSDPLGPPPPVLSSEERTAMLEQTMALRGEEVPRASRSGVVAWLVSVVVVAAVWLWQGSGSGGVPHALSLRVAVTVVVLAYLAHRAQARQRR